MNNLINPINSFNWINHYMNCPYVDGGRGPDVFDCWGLVRDVYHRRFGLPLLKSFGQVSPDDKDTLTQAFYDVVPDFTPGPPALGTVAGGFRGGNLIHVGVVVDNNGRLEVLHTGRKHGPTLTRVAAFSALFSNVVYYHYDCKNLRVSKQVKHNPV